MMPLEGERLTLCSWAPGDYRVEALDGLTSSAAQDESSLATVTV